jgi:hypothetical protein
MSLKFAVAGLLALAMTDVALAGEQARSAWQWSPWVSPWSSRRPRPAP